MGEDLKKLKQRLSLLDYLRQQNWVLRPAGHGPEFVGLCPLHPETRPSFYVNACKNLFYCHGCGQGGDLLRFVQLSPLWSRVAAGVVSKLGVCAGVSGQCGISLTHPQFSNPDANFASPTFGVISSTAVNPRVGQLALRFSF